MNKILAKISKIHNIENLNIVDFEFDSIKFKMMSLELNEKATIGKKVTLTIKPTNVAIAKDFQGSLSYSNQIPAIVEKIEKGNLLCVVNTKIKDIPMQSVFTSSSLEKMDLKEKDKVSLLFKASDLSIMEIIND